MGGYLHRKAALVFLTTKAGELEPCIQEFADELNATLGQPFSREEMDTLEHVLRALAEASD